MKITRAISAVILLALTLLTAACNSPTQSGNESKPTSGQTTGQVPIITGFSPSWQFPGSAITIFGANFDTTSANNIVKFNGITAPQVASASATSLAVIVPQGATVGPITVTTQEGTATSPTSFVVMGGSAAPTITAISPGAGIVGTAVTITGTNFYTTPGNTIVTFNGTRANVTSASETTLTVAVPDGASGNITVTTPGGTAISPGIFAMTSPEGTSPIVKYFSPVRGITGATVIISGRNFDTTPGNNLVKFNGTAAAVTDSSDTSLTVTVPAAATTGPITVTDPAGTGKSATSFTVTGVGGGITGLMGGAIQGNNLNASLKGTALTFAGGGVVNSSVNGTGTNARFNNPNGIASDGTNLYIADSGNRVIRRIDISTGVVTTLAGSGLAGSADGPGLAAGFSTPNGITTDGTSLYVADSGNNRIRKISPLPGISLAAMTSSDAVVTTLAGSGSMGFTDAVGTSATFKGPYGITTDGTNLFVADGSNRIRKIVIASRTVTTLAGSGAFSSTDGNGTAATFYRPHGITISPDYTTLFVTDSGTNVIRKIVIATGDVTRVAGSGIAGASDGTGAAASFQNPNGITTDGTNLYVTDTGNNTVRQIVIATSKVTTLAGTGKVGAADNSAALLASFRLPSGIVMAGTDLYISDSGNNEIRKISGQAVTTFAGSLVTPSSMNGVGTSTKFSFPYGITTDGSNLYVADSGSRLIRKIVISSGVVTTLAGSGYFGSIDARGVSASFNYPMGITTDGVNLYLVDAGNQKIRQIDISTGAVTTLAGTGAVGSRDDVGSAATFSQPFGITTDGTYLYVADSGNNKIRKIDLSTREVTTLAGSGVAGSTDSVGIDATFWSPSGITTDGTNLYVADTGNNKIRRIIISNGVVTTLAGSGLYWNDDLYDNIVDSKIGTAANFRHPAGITTDGTYLFVADSDNNLVRKIEIATATVKTLVGSGAFGSTDGTGTEASFSQPVGITTDGTALYTTEYLNNLIRKIQ